MAAWIAAGLLAGALLGAILSRALSPGPRAQASPAVRSTISLPAGTRLWFDPNRPSWAFSSDGRKLVFRATKDGVSQLYLRDLSKPDAEPVAGTQGAFNPFFSPDGEWLAFFSGNDLRKVALSGGPPAVIAPMPPVSYGGTWAADGSIIVAPRSNGGLARLAAGAKDFETLTEPDVSRGEHALVLPQALPGGREVLVVVRAGRDFDDFASSNVAVHSLATGKRRVLVEGSPWARYVEPGRLLFAKGTTIFAATVDPRSWTLTGPAVPLIRDVRTSFNDAVPYLEVSDRGLLAFSPGGAIPPAPDTAAWVDRAGKEEALPLSGLKISVPRISPDGKTVLLATRRLADSPRHIVSVYDFARGVLTTLTPEPGRHFAPIWLPDGRRIFYAAYESGNPRLAWKASDGTGEAQLLSPEGTPAFPSSVSPDGKTLLFASGGNSGEKMNIWTMSLDGKREQRPWLAAENRLFAGFFSPDGRNVVYVSNESGKNEVYARPYAGPGGKIKISSDGGSEPAWAPSGREIFYRTADAMMAVPVTTQPELSAGTGRPLFPDRYARWGREDGSRNYDVSPDGSRFLVIKTAERKDEPVTQIQLLANWPAELPVADALKR
jgi:serine/threonine-protein kinase